MLSDFLHKQEKGEETRITPHLFPDRIIISPKAL